VTILLYHRIAEPDSDPWDLAVSPHHFDQHLRVLSEIAPVIPLRQLVTKLRSGRLPRRSFVITFDDGYADNLINAKPLLEKYDSSATVFITTKYTNSDREFWWDELDRLLVSDVQLPDSIRLKLRGSVHYSQCVEPAATPANIRGRTAWKQDDDSRSRCSLYQDICALMRPLVEEDRDQIRNELLHATGSTGVARTSYRALSEHQILELVDGGLIEVGCHTATHPQLSALSSSEQRNEIVQSKRRLENLLDRTITSFAYPYGWQCDYTRETTALVREAGFDCACSVTNRCVDRHSDVFQLPRLQVPNIDGEAFQQWLAGLND